MDQQPQMPPQAPPPKKRMSRGCMIGLIALGVVIVLVVIAGITCYVYKDDIAKSGAIYLINSVKTEVAANPPQGVDTVQFNQVIDSFVARFKADSMAVQKMPAFFQTIQSVPEDSKVDSSEVRILIEAMVSQYPELEELVGEKMIEESADTTGMSAE